MLYLEKIRPPQAGRLQSAYKFLGAFCRIRRVNLTPNTGVHVPSEFCNFGYCGFRVETIG